jgi:hypothetical protein
MVAIASGRLDETSFRQIVAGFSTFLNGYLLKLCPFAKISWERGGGQFQSGLEMPTHSVVY